MRATRPALRDLTKRMERQLDNTFLPLTQQSSSSSDQHVCGVMCGGQFSVCCVLSENENDHSVRVQYISDPLVCLKRRRMVH